MMCMKAIQFYIVCLLPVLAGCADDTVLPSVPEGTPLTVTAEISVPDAARTMAPTRAVATDNGYDRSTFRSGGLYAFRHRRVDPFGSGLGIAF